MRLILQRVRRAEVRVSGRPVSSIGAGVLVLAGIEKGDISERIRRAAEKLHHLRLFADARGRMNLAAHEVAGSFMIVSQFTLAASLARGRRPSFENAARPEAAEPLVQQLGRELEALGDPVEYGVFGAEMEVELVNDGPVTFVLDL